MKSAKHFSSFYNPFDKQMDSVIYFHLIVVIHLELAYNPNLIPIAVIFASSVSKRVRNSPSVICSHGM